MTISSPGHFISDMGQAQGTNDTPLQPSDIRKKDVQDTSLVS